MHANFLLLHDVMKAVNCTVIVVAAHTSVLACILRVHHFQIQYLVQSQHFPGALFHWFPDLWLIDWQTQKPGLVSDDEMGKISGGDHFSIK